jgi:ribonuclease HI
MPVIECDVDAAREKLAREGATVTDGNTKHERWRATRGDATAVAYDGKVVVQGSRPTDITALLEEGKGGRVHVYFDGASHGNPGPAAIGWVLVSPDGVVAEGGERIGRATNNQAEYEALLTALEMAADYGFDEVAVRGDSELIVKQVKGAWSARSERPEGARPRSERRVKRAASNIDPELREKRVRARELLHDFESWSLTHVPREINERADELATEALEE